MGRLFLFGLIPFLLLSARADPPDASPQQDLSSLSLEELLKVRVVAAALHSQTLRDAPASVTVITAEEIYKYGYRTLGEALDSVRGFTTNYNRTYRSVGVRGFNLPWDYGSRILVMVNGHNLADHIFDSMLWFGDDFPIDMHLVKQIEIIRGPSSALYGSNGEFATINVVTKSPADVDAPSMTARYGTFGERKIQAMGSVPIGSGANLLLSGTVFNNRGESPLYFPGLDSPDTNHGQAVGMDGEKGYHFFSNFTWRDWNITAVLSNRNKIQPVSWGPTVFNDRGTKVDETANFVEAAYTRELGRGSLQWRTYFNQDRLHGRFHFPLRGAGSDLLVEDNRSATDSDWIGTELTYRFSVARLGTFTAGANAEFDLRPLQTFGEVSPAPVEFVHIDRGDQMYALFLQNERALSRNWTLDLGVRFDGSVNRRSFVSPRAALIYQPSDNWTYKFLYGRAFRNPNLFDLFFDDGIFSLANPTARPESLDTLEIDAERKIGKRVNLAAAAYGYRLDDFLVSIYTPGGLLQTQNAGRIRAAGLELEVQARPAPWLEATASYSIQLAEYADSHTTLPNSPNHLAKLHFAVPLGPKLDLSSGMQYFSSRDSVAGASLRPAYLVDFTLSTRRLLPNLDFRAGVRNAFNRNYADPVALDPRVDAMQQPGRTGFVELIVHGGR